MPGEGQGETVPERRRTCRAELERIEKGLPTTERVVPERKPITSRQITVQFSLRKLFVPALAALIIIAAARRRLESPAA